MSEEQRKLSGFDEAEKIDAQTSKYFKPEINLKYELEFSAWSLVEKDLPTYETRNKPDNEKIYVKKVALNLQVSKENGMPVDKEWSILNAKLRNQMRVPCETGVITKRRYSFTQKGTGISTQYIFNDIGDKGASGSAPSAKNNEDAFVN